jgi:hypothetical protein
MAHHYRHIIAQTKSVVFGRLKSKHELSRDTMHAHRPNAYLRWTRLKDPARPDEDACSLFLSPRLYSPPTKHTHSESQGTHVKSHTYQAPSPEPLIPNTNSATKTRVYVEQSSNRKGKAPCYSENKKDLDLAPLPSNRSTGPELSNISIQRCLVFLRFKPHGQV